MERSRHRLRERNVLQRSGSARQQHRKAVASELEFSSCCRRALHMPSIQSPASTSLGGSLQPLADPNERVSQPFALPSPPVLTPPRGPPPRPPPPPPAGGGPSPPPSPSSVLATGLSPGGPRPAAGGWSPPPAGGRGGRWGKPPGRSQDRW